MALAGIVITGLGVLADENAETEIANQGLSSKFGLLFLASSRPLRIIGRLRNSLALDRFYRRAQLRAYDAMNVGLTIATLGRNKQKSGREILFGFCHHIVDDRFHVGIR